MSSMPASTKKGGMAFAMPDVCKTSVGPSVVPIPYPNIAQLSGADRTVDKVLIENKEVVVEDSKIPSSSGDEAGTLKGVTSSTTRGEARFKQYSSKVYAKGKKIVHHTATTSHNGSNANMPSGTHTTASQNKVLVAR
jgi:hypothetical protein